MSQRHEDVDKKKSFLNFVLGRSHLSNKGDIFYLIYLDWCFILLQPRTVANMTFKFVDLLLERFILTS